MRVLEPGWSVGWENQQFQTGSGHVYFSLKTQGHDFGGHFRLGTPALGQGPTFDLRDGMQVLCRAWSLFIRRGRIPADG